MEEWRKQADKLIQGNRVEEAIVFCREQAEKTSGYDETAKYLIQKGAVVGSKDEPHSALLLFKAAREMAMDEKTRDLAERNLMVACNNYALYLTGLKRYSEAEEQYKRALQLKEGDPTFHSNYGALLTDLKRYSEAEEQYKRALQLKEDYPTIQSNYAILLGNLKRYAEAEEHHKRAIQLRINDPIFHGNYGNFLRELGRYPEAEEHYRRALRLDRNDRELHSNYGALLADLKRYAEAEEQYKRAIKLKEDYPEAHNNYALLLGDLRRYSEAESHYKRAIQLKKDDPEIHNNYGKLLNDLERYAEAEEQYKRALQLKEDYPEAHNNFGNLLSDLNLYPEAEEHYRRAYEQSAVERDEVGVAFASANMTFLLLHSLRLGEGKQWSERAREGFDKAGQGWQRDAIRMLGWARLIEAIDAWRAGRWEESDRSLREAEDQFAKADREQDRLWVSVLRGVSSIDEQLSQIARMLQCGAPIHEFKKSTEPISRNVDTLLPLLDGTDGSWNKLLRAKLTCVRSLMDLIGILTGVVHTTDLGETTKIVERIHNEFTNLLGAGSPSSAFQDALGLDGAGGLMSFSNSALVLIESLKEIDHQRRISLVTNFFKTKRDALGAVVMATDGMLTERSILLKARDEDLYAEKRYAEPYTPAPAEEQRGGILQRSLRAVSRAWGSRGNTS